MKRALFVVVWCLPALAIADEITLKSGGKLVGQIVSEDARTLVVEVGPGRVSVPRAGVVKVERGQSALSVFRDRASRLGVSDTQGWLELAFWAQERDLLTQAHEAFERVLRLDSGNNAANAALGRVRQDGRWMTTDESYRARGYVHYDGEWMTPAQQEARIRAKTAEAQAAAQREGDWRAREAEARARQAEAEARQAEAEAQGASAEGGIPLWWGGDGGTVVVDPPTLPPPTPQLPATPPLPPPPDRLMPEAVAPEPRENPEGRPAPPHH